MIHDFCIQSLVLEKDLCFPRLVWLRCSLSQAREWAGENLRILQALALVPLWVATLAGVSKLAVKVMISNIHASFCLFYFFHILSNVNMPSFISQCSCFQLKIILLMFEELKCFLWPHEIIFVIGFLHLSLDNIMLAFGVVRKVVCCSPFVCLSSPR